MVPSRIRSVTIAAAVSVTQASGPHTDSQVKIASHPAASAATASSANSRPVPALITTPVCSSVMRRTVPDGYDSAGSVRQPERQLGLESARIGLEAGIGSIDL